MSLEQRLGITNPLFIMDGTAFIYRGYYANSSLSRSDGFPTNAIYTLTRLLLRIIREEKPKQFIFIMDGKGTNFRHDIFPLYKANRNITPDNLIKQLEPIKRIIQNLGITLYVSDGYEADDCIASLAKRFSSHKPVIIIGADKDLKQCLNKRTWLWDPSGKNEKLTSVQDFTQETGLLPTQWPDVQALIGDVSDNIPGVPGIGPKTAQKIFMDFSSLEDIRDNFSRLSQKMQDKIFPHLESIFLYRKLTTLNTECCNDIEEINLNISSIIPEKIIKTLQEFELTSLQRELASMFRTHTLTNPNKNKNIQINFLQNLNSKAEPENDNTLIDKKQNKISSTSVDKLPPCTGENIAIFPAKLYTTIRYDNGFIIGMGNEEWHILQDDIKQLIIWCKNCTHIITPDLKLLFNQNQIWLEVSFEKWFDLGLAAYLLRPEDKDYSWPRLTIQWDDTDTNKQILTTTARALNIRARLMAELLKNDLYQLYKNIELPLIPVLAFMELKGIAINYEAFLSFLNDVQTEIDTHTKNIFQIAGTTFNIRSAQQLSEVLFSTLKLPSTSKTRGGLVSTAQEKLEKLSGNPIIDAVLEFRKLEKLRSTYLEPLPKFVDTKGRIHSTFNQWSTTTCRLSSSNPNLQNIPIRGVLGKRMRTCFVPQNKHLLISADYSQVELRVLAHMSQDPVLLKSFRDNQDIHTNTAALIYNIHSSEVNSEQRRNAKTINFGLIYGMGAQKLAQELKITTNQAKSFIEHYFKHLQKLKNFYENIEIQTKNLGFVTTLTGRKRNIPDIHSTNGQKFALARRQAINTVIQGTAADIIKLAMLNVANDIILKNLNASLILQVHDELILEVPEENAQQAGQHVAKIMSSIRPNDIQLDVPLIVDWAVGHHWGEAH